jgi:hypothetical protein
VNGHIDLLADDLGLMLSITIWSGAQRVIGQVGGLSAFRWEAAGGRSQIIVTYSLQHHQPEELAAVPRLQAPPRGSSL